MIRPIFNVSQDESFIYIEAKVKYVKISDFEYFIEENNFRFTLKPYYLNINLPKKLNSESNLNSFIYEPENQRLLCKIQKYNLGENFENLEFISTLYDQNKSNNDKSLSDNKTIFSKIEEIKKDYDDELENKVINIIIKNEKDLNDYLFNKYTKEKNKNNLETITDINSITKEIKNLDEYKYGFNNNFSDVFDKRKEELLELCDLNPKEIPINKRYFYKLEKENKDFNSERYITDLFLDDEKSDFFDEFFANIIEKNLDKKDKKFLESIKDKKNSDNFDELENEVLYKISKLNINGNKNNINNKLRYQFNIYLNVIDILFSFLYNCLVTEYENNSESGWNINKLSSTLSCLMDFDLNYYSQSNEISFDILNETIENLIISNYRRALIYPLYRNLKLCKKIKYLLCEVLELGRFSILKCLLKIKNIFDRNEPRFLLNVIYIDPLIKWIQNDADDKFFEIIKNVINKLTIKKEQLKLDLNTFENEYLNNIDTDIEMDEDK